MDLSLATILMLVAIGIAAGVSAGFIGIGGGLIMVPVLLELYRAWGLPPEVLVQAAMGTSLTVATFNVASSALRHHRQHNVIWRLVPLVAPSSMLGGWIATVIAGYLPGSWLQIGLASVLLAAALKMLLEKKVEDKPLKHVSVPGWIFIGVIVGLFAGLTGLAGGLVFVPAMAFIAHIPVKKLAGTSSAVVMFTALAAAFGYIFSTPAVPLPQGFFGHSNLLVAVCLAVTSIPAAQLGAYLNKIAGSLVYKRIFGVLLILVVLRLYFTA